MSYLQTVEDVYTRAAESPDAGLCCTPGRGWHLPDLVVPPIMHEMNYGCGSTVDPRDLRSEDTILYVGVGGGLEALQFAYFARRPGGVIAVDPVGAMRERARANFALAARLNRWFRPEFVELREGTAMALPVADHHVSVAAQNCLFNVFREDDLDLALGEIVRVLRPGGFFASSDPVAPVELPMAFRADDVARARCLSGCLTFESHLGALTRAGFGRIEVRARFPYRFVTPAEYPSLDRAVLLESIEVVAYKVPDGPDGPAIFTGRTAVYGGPSETFDDGRGNVLRRGIPMPVSDAAARRLADTPAITITPPTYHARGSGCC
jgi:SAM-dependent methyltransferase